MREWVRNRRLWIKYQTSKVWQFFKPVLKRAGGFFLVAGVVAGAWYVFLSIIDAPPMETTPALIMVWASVLVLLFALFPNVLDKVKKIKLKDFEIELQETVAKATSKDFISFSDIDDHIFSTKGDFRNLSHILERTVRSPRKPVLLVANLREDDYISIPMLFIYLFFLDLVGAPVTLLLVSSSRIIQSFTDISKDIIVGAVNGKRAIQVFLERFPELSRIFEFARFSDNIKFEDFLRSGRLRDGFEDLFPHINNLRLGPDLVHSRHLTRRDVENWFRGELSSRAVESLVSGSDVEAIRRAIAEDDEFVLVFRDNRLASVVPVCFLTRDVSRKFFEKIAG